MKCKGKERGIKMNMFDKTIEVAQTFLQLSGISDKSEARYYTMGYSPRMRIATHSPVYDCSGECFCVQVGEGTGVLDADFVVKSEQDILPAIKAYLAAVIEHELTAAKEELEELQINDGDTDDIEEAKEEVERWESMTVGALIDERLADIAEWRGQLEADRVREFLREQGLK